MDIYGYTHKGCFFPIKPVFDDTPRIGDGIGISGMDVRCAWKDDLPRLDELAAELEDQVELSGSYAMSSEDRILSRPDDDLPLQGTAGKHPSLGYVFILRNGNGGWLISERALPSPDGEAVEYEGDFISDLSAIGVIDLPQISGFAHEVTL